MKIIDGNIPSNIHFKWAGSIEPIVYVKPGEELEIIVPDSSTNQITENFSTSDMQRIDESKFDGAVGPIYVEGAGPDSNLLVELVDIRTQDWGWSAILKNYGLLKGEFEERMVIWSIDIYGDGMGSRAIQWFSHNRSLDRRRHHYRPHTDQYISAFLFPAETMQLTARKKRRHENTVLFCLCRLHAICAACRLACSCPCHMETGCAVPCTVIRQRIDILRPVRPESKVSFVDRKVSIIEKNIRYGIKSHSRQHRLGWRMSTPQVPAIRFIITSLPEVSSPRMLPSQFLV